MANPGTVEVRPLTEFVWISDKFKAIAPGNGLLPQNYVCEARKLGKSIHPHKHERLKYRVLTFIEQHLFGGRQIFSFRNYRLK